MCLVTNQKVPRRTKKDLVVWKYGSVDFTADNKKVFHSLFYHSEWKEGELKKSNLDVERVEYILAGKFDKLADDSYQKEQEDNTIVTEVSTGLHASVTRKRLEYSGYSFSGIHRFVIPAGSLVFTDKSGLIVSNKMYWAPKTEPH